MSFGETLQKLRKQKGWSQEELAERLELTRQTVSKWELEQSTPDLDYIVALCDLFQVSADYLIRGKEYAAEGQETVPAKNAEITNRTSDMKPTVIWVIMGSVLLLLGLGGVIGFMGLAAVSPPATADINGFIFTGLLGFLICYDAIPYFILCALLVLAGAALYALALIKHYRRKKRI